MVDNCKVNELVRLYFKSVKDKDMTGFYLLHERFDRLSEKERAAALLDILFFRDICKSKP